MECAICFDVPSEATELACGHAYHKGCLFSWVKACKETATCPLCRTVVDECEKGETAAARCMQLGVMMDQMPIIKRAADFGSSKCAFTLAEFHYLGQGVGQDHALAEKYFKQAEEYSVSCRRLARYACGRSETAQAVAYLRRAIEISPAIGINYMVLAHVLEDSDEAVGLYMTVLALYVDDHVIQERVYVLLGKHQFKQNKWVEAFGYFQKCLEVNPGNHYAHMMAALTSANAETAHRHVDVILKAQPNDVAAVCMKGKIYLRENRLGEAEAMHVRARRLSASAVYTRELETELLVYENRLREAGPITRKRRLQK